MINEEIKSINNTPEALRKFGITVGMVFVIIGTLMFWFDTDGYIWFTLAGTFLVFSGIVFPEILKPFNIAWMMLGVLLGFVTSRIIMFLLFYLVLTPVSLLAKITGKKFLTTGFDEQKQSYWNYREKKSFQPEDYERQF